MNRYDAETVRAISSYTATRCNWKEGPDVAYFYGNCWIFGKIVQVGIYGPDCTRLRVMYTVNNNNVVVKYVDCTNRWDPRIQPLGVQMLPVSIEHMLQSTDEKLWNYTRMAPILKT